MSPFTGSAHHRKAFLHNEPTYQLLAPECVFERGQLNAALARIYRRSKPLSSAGRFDADRQAPAHPIGLH